MLSHKHKGVERSNGMFRSHPITQQHKETRVQRFHDQSLIKGQKKYKQGVRSLIAKKAVVTKRKKATVKQPTKQDFIKELRHQDDTLESRSKFVGEIDKDGYVIINFDNFKFQGLRIKKIQRQGRTKRTVGMQIPKDINLF